MCEMQRRFSQKCLSHKVFVGTGARWESKWDWLCVGRRCTQPRRRPTTRTEITTVVSPPRRSRVRPSAWRKGSHMRCLGASWCRRLARTVAFAPQRPVNCQANTAPLDLRPGTEGAATPPSRNRSSAPRRYTYRMSSPGLRGPFTGRHRRRIIGMSALQVIE